MNLKSVMKLGQLLMIASFFGSSTKAGQVSNIRADEEVLFFPSWASRAADDRGWELTLRGCVFEPEQRDLTLGLICRVLNTRLENLSTNEWTMLRERARLFMIDHQRQKRIIVRVGHEIFSLGKTGSNGQFQSTLILDDDQVQKLTTSFGTLPAFLEVALVLSPKDTRQFRGKVFLHPNQGLTVISDIDDTIKLSNVTNRSDLLRSTFFQPFQTISGMPALYTHWHLNGADFMYVSASPWQLLTPLSTLIESAGFPQGPFLLKNFRWRDSSFLALFQDPEEYKKTAITPILQRCPKRKFILVGDSGERDPEAFGSLARAFPNQIVQIAIRNVTNEPAESPRYQAAFRDLSRESWTVFSDPSEIKELTYILKAGGGQGSTTVAPQPGSTNHPSSTVTP